MLPCLKENLIEVTTICAILKMEITAFLRSKLPHMGPGLDSVGEDLSLPRVVVFFFFFFF